MKNREQANKELVEILTQLVKDNPTERFHQILRNYGFIQQGEIDESTSSPKWINEFSTEPEVILKRVKEQLQKMES